MNIINLILMLTVWWFPHVESSLVSLEDVVCIGRTDADFGQLMQRIDSLEKILMLGKTEGKTRRGQQRVRWLDIITGSVDTSRLSEIVKDKNA